MDSTAVLVLTALCVGALLPGSEAQVARCYACSSNHDPRCADPIDKTLLPLECSREQVKRAARALADVLGPSASSGADAFGERIQDPNAVMTCQKIVVDVPNLSGQAYAQNVTVRGCALLTETPFDHCDHVARNLQTDRVRATFCGTCVAEGCNGGTALSASILAVVVPAVLALVLAGRR